MTETSVPGFYWQNRAWYAAANNITLPAVEIGLYYLAGGGTEGEFHIEWHELGGRLVPQLALFDDAWKLLARPDFAPLWAWLANHDNQYITDADLVTALRNFGFHDLTAYQREA